MTSNSMLLRSGARGRLHEFLRKLFVGVGTVINMVLVLVVAIVRDVQPTLRLHMEH